MCNDQSQKVYIGRQIKYPDFVDIECIVSEEEQGYRYSLTIPFHNAEIDNKLVVIMKNPSSANGTKCDMTISKVCNVAHHNGYSGVIILNLFPFRATTASQVRVFYAYPNYQQKMQENLDTIKNICATRDTVFAWGTNTIGGIRKYPNNYNNAIQNVVNAVKGQTYFVKKCRCVQYSCNAVTAFNHPSIRFPLHGLQWNNDSVLIPY